MVGLCACEGGVGVDGGSVFVVKVVGLLSGICESFQWWLLGWAVLGRAEVLLGGVLFVRTEWLMVVAVVVVVMSAVLVVVGRGCLHVWVSVGVHIYIYIHICIHLQEVVFVGSLGVKLEREVAQAGRGARRA